MSDDYLWDGSGPPDPEVARLERLLGGLRHQGAPPPLPERTPRSPRSPSSWPGWLLVAAAAAMLLASAAIGLRARMLPAVGQPDGWTVEVVAGAPSWGGSPQRDPFTLRAGGWLETDDVSEARVEVADIGFLDVAPDSRLRLLHTRADEHRLELARGRIDAKVLAPPRLLVVETPAATAVDLGCAYTLAVDDGGAGFLEVRSGWVALEHPDRSSFVPAGARAETRAGQGPGTPWFLDASPALRGALDEIDFGPPDEQAVATALSEARDRDTLSLVHLIERVPGPDRGRVYDRIQALVPPITVGREEAVRLDAGALADLLREVSIVW